MYVWGSYSNGNLKTTTIMFSLCRYKMHVSRLSKITECNGLWIKRVGIQTLKYRNFGAILDPAR